MLEPQLQRKKTIVVKCIIFLSKGQDIFGREDGWRETFIDAPGEFYQRGISGRRLNE